jgi:hypothetical protein
MKRLDLNLIMCNKCGLHIVLELETRTDEKGNQHCIFYKCPAYNVSYLDLVV